MWRGTINTAKPVGFIMMCLVSNPLYCQWLHNVLYSSYKYTNTRCHVPFIYKF